MENWRHGRGQKTGQKTGEGDRRPGTEREDIRHGIEYRGYRKGDTV